MQRQQKTLKRQKRSIWRRLLLAGAAAVLLLFTVATLLLLFQQDRIVQNAIGAFNAEFSGAIVLHDSDISPLANFPYVSVVLEGVQVYEDKNDLFAPILDVSHVYLGFNVHSILSGRMKARLLRIENGNFDIVRHTDGSLNLTNALSGDESTDGVREAYHLELSRIELANLDIIHYDEGTGVHVETYIRSATSALSNTEEQLSARLQSDLVLNVINNGDSTVFTNRAIRASTAFEYTKKNQRLSLEPSVLRLNNGDIHVNGSVDFGDTTDYDLGLHGSYPNFDLLISFAPEQLVPTLQQYENAGSIGFEASVQGASADGSNPPIEASFRCDSAYFRNPVSGTKLEQIRFSGTFTNGAARNASTMEFVLENMSARPESGTFVAALNVRNFEQPQIDMSVTSHFDLDFLARFLNVSSLQDLRGDVSLQLNFRDIIDLQNPEKSLEEFSQSYYSTLQVRNLSFLVPGYPLRFDSIDIKASMNGNRAAIDYIFMNIGDTDFTVRGEIDNLPAIVHQTDDSVAANLFMYSSFLDLGQLQAGDSCGVDRGETMYDTRLELAFNARAADITKFDHLPEGDFYIRHFYGKPEHYPHTFKDFEAHVVLGEEALEVRNLTGSIDQSTLMASGVVYNYPLLLQDTVRGALDLDFSLRSDALRLSDLFSYRGQNYMPPEYRKETIKDLVMYGNTQIYFDDSARVADVYFDQLSATAVHHGMQIRDIHGKVQVAREAIALDQLGGHIGNTAFSADMHFYLGENDSIRKATNVFSLTAELMDFDELSNYASRQESGQHTDRSDTLYNLYALPFTDFQFEFRIDTMRYHRHLIKDLQAQLSMSRDQQLTIDQLSLHTAGGQVQLSGHFDGSDPDSIYFYPVLVLEEVGLSDLLYQFDNFGQEQIISDNLRGQLSGRVMGALRVQPNMVPDIGASDLVMDLTITRGELRNYKPFVALADYFSDKNLSRVRFDTLDNQLRIHDGLLVIPSMKINSSLGYMDISGRQDMQQNMEYYFRIPFKMVTRAATQKLFGKRDVEIDSTQVDAIQRREEGKKRWYVNLKLEGTPEDYTVRLEKKKG